MTEHHDFRMHPRMLLDIIQKQAGTLDKAVLEAVMNSIEAGASRVDIEFTDLEQGRQLVIIDDGCGIQTREELEQHFKTFGTPHSADENKVYARFRMGRGQLFAMGRNVWRTCQFRMETDIRADVKADRLPRFALTNYEFLKGCRIEINLYNDKWYSTIAALQDAIKEQIEFVNIPIYFNGVRLSRDVTKLKWTYQDDDAYYLFGVGTDLIIYNLGARCEKIPASTAGAVGIIVSKKQLDVNFARNQVLSECPVMQRINVVIKANRIKKTRKTHRRLNDDEKTAAIRDLRDGNLAYGDVANVSLFETSSGRALNFNAIKSNRLPWTFAPANHAIADKLTQSGKALCINEDILNVLNYSDDPADFFGWFARRGKFPSQYQWERLSDSYRPFQELKAGYSDKYELVPKELWTRFERRLIRVLTDLDCWQGRIFLIGISDAHDAWTDGYSTITLNRGYLDRADITSMQGAAGFFALLCHELSHDDSTEGTHVHGEAFYRNFHDLINYGRVSGEGMGYPGGPMRYVERYRIRMQNAVKEEKTEAAILRQEKAKKRVERALTSGANLGAVQSEWVKKHRRPTGIRMPRGAE